MKESCGKGPASHPDPESCGSGRKALAEALTGAHAGQPLSCEIRQSGVPMLLREAEGHTRVGVRGEPTRGPAQSKTLSRRENSSHGNREIPSPPATGGVSGRPEKATSRTSGVHGDGKSDGRIVPQKPPNKDGPPTSAEVVEGRRPTKGNTLPQATSRTQSRTDVSSRLHRVRQAARKDKRARFTTLLHQVSVDLPRDSFYALKRQAAPGVDGVTWQEYEEGLEGRLAYRCA
jgi:RNA-directed DNA polymerase